MLLNTILALILGSVLGMAFGLVAEMLDRRVRSTGDLASMGDVPVLGNISWAPPKPRSRLAALLTPRRLRLT
jgi:capsular polysaccharide biosynthesis protein